MIAGARQGKPSGLRRLIASAMARDLNAFVIPGPDVARAHGLDIEAAGLRLVASPRHASVLLVVAAIPPALREAAAVVYAQMMRPRALFVLGTDVLSPLPAADVTAGLSQQDLVEGVHHLRRAFANGAFRPQVADFDAPVLQIRIEYTCPMHPEIIRDEPGSCPKCGMDLVPRETQANTEPTPMDAINTDAGTDMPMASTHDHHDHNSMSHDAAVEYTCPMHPEIVQNEPGSCPKCGMFLVPRETPSETPHDHQHMSEDTLAPVEYTCPMHPEVVQNEPGSCPKCGMFLVPRETPSETPHDHQHMSEDTPAPVEYTCPMHPEVIQSEPGSCPKCGMFLVPRETPSETPHDHQHMAEDTPAPVEYTCPMHPEIVQNEPGSCPKCGMFLEPRETQKTHEHGNTDAHSDHSGMNHAGTDHSAMDHDEMNHDDMGFMSMIDVTKDLPRSGDGLPMEWIAAPFGPFFPGLPGGLLLTLTLDGDTVAASDARALTGNVDLLAHADTDSAGFVEHLASMDPLTPVAYRLLACRALENAAGINLPGDIACARAAALERERIASHLGWLELFAQQTGFGWLMRRAASLQLKCQHASLEQLVALKPAIQSLLKRLQRTPLLKSRTVGIGRLSSDNTLRGPVARASGSSDDARSTDPAYAMLEFAPASRNDSDAFARLHIRLDEITHSLALIEAAGAIELPMLLPIGDASGTGDASVETARGPARLQLTLEKGQVIAAQLETPSTPHLDLIDPLVDQQELGDALVAVGSLDLSPWQLAGPSPQALVQ